MENLVWFIVLYFIDSTVKEANFQWSGCPDWESYLKGIRKAFAEYVKSDAQQFESDHRRQIEQFADQIPDLLEISLASFLDIADQIVVAFADSRVEALFAFVAAISRRCANPQLSPLLSSLGTYLHMALESHHLDSVIENDIWAQFVDDTFGWNQKLCDQLPDGEY